MDIVDILFLLILTFGLLSNFLSIPGNFVVAFNALWYGLATNFETITFSFFITLIIIAAAIEFVEYLIIALGAKRYGASRWGVVGAILGGIIGGLSGFTFSPIFGAIIGGFFGVIMGTMLLELIIKKRNFDAAYHAMLGALIGKVGGLTVKVIGTLTMAVVVGYKVFL
jgi:uncharacterized protein YqgC (DUF456 family)